MLEGSVLTDPFLLSKRELEKEDIVLEKARSSPSLKYVDGVGEREQQLLLKGGQEGLTFPPPPTFYQGHCPGGNFPLLDFHLT